MNMDLEMADIARNAAEATAYILVTAYTMEQAEKYGSFISSLSLLDMGSMNYWERFY